jgi:hypothetical protein
MGTLLRESGQFRPGAIDLRWSGAKRGQLAIDQDPSIISRMVHSPARGLGIEELAASGGPVGEGKGMSRMAVVHGAMR